MGFTSLLTHSLASPMLQQLTALANGIMQATQLGGASPQYFPNQPAEEPWEYLPPPQTVVMTDTFWGVAGLMGSFASISAVYLGIGGCVGLSLGVCFGIGKEPPSGVTEEDVSNDSLMAELSEDQEDTASDFEGDSEKDIKREIINKL